jgi:hypothetical protein
MERDDLVALIPVDGAVAKKKDWTMPAPNLYERLIEKTHGRVLRSDAVWSTERDLPPTVTLPDLNAARQDPNIVVSDLHIDYLLR